ncbi:hypothetical protein LTR93_011248 [Exophiala xenobiotica]|nr:hypothetical protein LTR93_011248 [Exophiala xenobiotica]
MTVGHSVSGDLENNIDATIAHDELPCASLAQPVDGTTPANATGGLPSGSMPAVAAGIFQAVSVAQKTKDYLNDALIILASKHGQAPIILRLWNEVDPDALMNALSVPTPVLTVHLVSVTLESTTECNYTDDIGLLWLDNTADVPTAVANFKSNASSPKFQTIISNIQLTAQGFEDPMASSRVAHMIVRPDLGTCYSKPEDDWDRMRRLPISLAFESLKRSKSCGTSMSPPALYGELGK